MRKEKKEERKEEMIVLLILVSLIVLSWGKEEKKCNKEDFRIYSRTGSTFPHRFRAFGGMTVSKASYESSVRSATGLSIPCSECYGDAYICGYENCFWSCASEGTSCNQCLINEKCIEKVNTCTGF